MICKEGFEPWKCGRGLYKTQCWCDLDFVSMIVWLGMDAFTLPVIHKIS